MGDPQFLENDCPFALFFSPRIDRMLYDVVNDLCYTAPPGFEDLPLVVIDRKRWLEVEFQCFVWKQTPVVMIWGGKSVWVEKVVVFHVFIEDVKNIVKYVAQRDRYLPFDAAVFFRIAIVTVHAAKSVSHGVESSF